jgi:hypothetical protein
VQELANLGSRRSGAVDHRHVLADHGSDLLVDDRA